MFTIEGASPVASLDRTNAYYASNDYANKNYPGDTSYDQIFKGAAKVSLLWGKV